MKDRDMTKQTKSVEGAQEGAQDTGRGSWRAWAWALVPFAILGSGLAGLGVMTALALDDPGFALEKDYYAKSLRIDERQAQEQQNRSLGWHLDVETVEVGPGQLDVFVTLRGDSGPLEGAEVSAEAFHNARAADVRVLEFVPEADGRLRARLDAARPGLWELRFNVQRYGARFTEVQRHQLGTGGKS